MDIKKVIKLHGYTFDKLSSEMGLTKGSLSQSVNGNPTIETLRRIADVLGCSVADFFADEMQGLDGKVIIIDGVRYRLTKVDKEN